MIKILFSNASFGGQTHSDVCSSYLQCDKLNKYMKIALGTGDFVRAMLRSQIFRFFTEMPPGKQQRFANNGRESLSRLNLARVAKFN